MSDLDLWIKWVIFLVQRVFLEWIWWIVILMEEENNECYRRK